ncbi:MAG: QueT transporter family protein, partial [Rubrobacteraceae bacterium]
MKEIFTMWRHTQMVVLVALSAAIYAAVLIPFKSFAIVPGFIEIRPANVFPVVFGLLFGPAGAWGSAIGNLIGDFFGSLSLGSIGGFVGNFFLALIPYKLWGAYFRNRNMETNVNSGEKLAVYIATTIVASLACADIISWWLSLLGLVPFTVALALITFNNAIMGSILGPFLLLALYP